MIAYVLHGKPWHVKPTAHVGRVSVVYSSDPWSSAPRPARGVPLGLPSLSKSRWIPHLGQWSQPAAVRPSPPPRRPYREHVVVREVANIV